jgi:hypothetical protein
MCGIQTVLLATKERKTERDCAAVGTLRGTRNLLLSLLWRACVPCRSNIKDIISLWVTQILQTYGDEESKDGAPVAEGSVDDLVGQPIFLALYPYFLKYGGVFKLCFGPKAGLHTAVQHTAVQHTQRTTRTAVDTDMWIHSINFGGSFRLVQF